MDIPIEHNGQIYDVVTIPGGYGIFDVCYTAPLNGDPRVDEIDERGFPEVFSERLGQFWLAEDDEDTRLTGRVRWSDQLLWDHSFNGMVQQIVVAYRACPHDDASQVDGACWYCDVCGTNFTREDDEQPEPDEDWDLDGPAHVRED